MLERAPRAGGIDPTASYSPESCHLLLGTTSAPPGSVGGAFLRGLGAVLLLSEAREMAQCLKEHSLIEDPGSVPSTHMTHRHTRRQNAHTHNAVLRTTKVWGSRPGADLCTHTALTREVLPQATGA